MTSTKTLLCVHAHPDDETLFTAGLTLHYADLGYRVVLVTCTLGQLGLDDHGRPGSDPRHDTSVTRATRAGELQVAGPMVGFTRMVSLGFKDSGMKGWSQNEDPTAFMNVDVDKVAATLASLIDEVDAQVVVTYDEYGFYGHPDHVMANVVTRRAVELSRSAERLYYPVAPRSVLEAFVPAAREMGVYLPAWILEANAGVPDDSVAATLDVRAYAATKQASIAAHASQIDNGDLVNMTPELFTLLFGTEYYQRAWSRTAASGDENDLFGGL